MKQFLTVIQKSLIVASTLYATQATAIEPIIIEQGGKNDPAARATFAEPRIFSLNFSNPLIQSEQILETGIVVDEIPALLDPRFEKLSNLVEKGEIKDDDYLLGIDVDGEIRYYPLAILNWHQGVNDTVKNTPVFISWDPLTGQPYAFNRKVEGQETEFGVSGLVYRSSTLYYDRASQGLWSPFLKKAVTGLYSGYTPEEITSFVTQAKAAQAISPRALTLTQDTGYARDYHKNPYGNYGHDKTMLFPVRYYDASLPRKEYVLGVRLTRGHRIKDIAIPVSSLMEWSQAKGIKFHLFSELFPGEHPIDVTVHYMEPLGRFEVTTPHADVHIETTYAYWFAWSAYHPKTTVIRHFEN